MKKCGCGNCFTPLHLHTDASPDGLGTVDKMVERAAEIGYDALAMTDHGTLANTIGFSQACQKHGVKPILGLEAYQLWNGTRHHLTLNATSPQGFSNLVNLNNKAHENWQNNYPVLDNDIISSADLTDIIMLSGCPAGAIHAGTEADAANWLGFMADNFGKENVYTEVMFVLSEDFVTRPVELAKKFGLKTVVTTDTHFALESQAFSHKVMTNCRKGFDYDSDNLWLKTPEQVLKAGSRLFNADDIQEWMKNAYEIGQSAEPWKVDDTVKLPDCSHLHAAFYTRLKNLLGDDLAGRDSDDVAERFERFQMELDTFEELEFIDYFVILDDIVGWAHEQGIWVGPGRGSASGSYILFLLDITALDPINHNMQFERFLNRYREGWPDVDVDIETDRRDEVLQYANRTWGGVPIAAYTHYSHKTVIHDVTRHLNLDRDLAQEAADFGNESQAFADWKALDPRIENVYDSMIGQIRHASKHAGGVVITSGDVPIEHIGDHLVAAWTEGHNKELSKAGIIKYDLLGVTAGSQLVEMERIAGVKAPLLPDDDDPAFSIFQKGDVSGVFQWSASDGIRELTQRIKPTKFIDLVTINSLYRPGALDAGTADLYPKLKDNPRLFGDERIDEILSETRGVLVFQEQVISIFAVVTGKTFAEADLARRVLFKVRLDDPKWVKSVEDMQSEFFTKGGDAGFDRRMLEQLWSEMFTHSRYSFNKAHSACYASVGWQMAWYKYYHPVAYYTAAFNYDEANAQSFAIEAVAKGIKLLPPHVNQPVSRYVGMPEKNAIRMPLSMVKFISEESAQIIVEEFERNGPFNSYAEFLSRVPKKKCNARARRNLYSIGAFEGLEGDRDEIFKLKEGETITKGFAAHIEVMNFIIPPKAAADHIAARNSLNDKNLVCGFVRDWSERTNKKGSRYNVYYIAPRGVFLLYDSFDKLKKGDFVEVEKGAYGRAKTRKKLKIKE